MLVREHDGAGARHIVQLRRVSRIVVAAARLRATDRVERALFGLCALCKGGGREGRRIWFDRPQSRGHRRRSVGGAGGGDAFAHGGCV